MVDLRERAEQALAVDRDYITATGSGLEWLIAQLACWPNRVDEEKTTNLRFLMSSAAATLRAQSAVLATLAEPGDEVVEAAEKGFVAKACELFQFDGDPWAHADPEMREQVRECFRAAIAAFISAVGVNASACPPSAYPPAPA